jgi:hypothetical protein
LQISRDGNFKVEKEEKNHANIHLNSEMKLMLMNRSPQGMIGNHHSAEIVVKLREITFG